MGLEWNMDDCYSKDDEDKLQKEIYGFLESSDLFTVYREVTGKLLYRHPSKESGDVRIDFILAPKMKLFDAGWTSGCIGIEVKLERKSGKGLSQVLDYRNSSFLLEPFGSWIVPTMVAIMPYHATGDLSSVLVQNGCGTARIRHGILKIVQGGTNILCFDSSGEIHLINNKIQGNKVGSR